MLLIDEPVAGMTPRESELTGELLLSMAHKHTLLVIDHDMTFVRQIASKVTVLDEGQTLCEGTVDEVQNDPRRHRGLSRSGREEYAPDRVATDAATRVTRPNEADGIHQPAHADRSPNWKCHATNSEVVGSLR